MPSAARVTDQISHSDSKGGEEIGAVGGAVAGAIIGVAVIGLAAAASIFSGGLAAAPAILLAGTILTGLAMGGGLGRTVGEHILAPCGKITSGVHSIFIGPDRQQAATCGSEVACDHDTDHEQVAEGSSMVFFGPGGSPAARVGDKGSCGFVIAEGLATVQIGGGTSGCEGVTVGSEVPLWLDIVVNGSGIVGGILLAVGGGMEMAARGVSWIGVRLLAGAAIGGGLQYGGTYAGRAGGAWIDKKTGSKDGFWRDVLGETGGDVAPIAGLGVLGKFPGRYGTKYGGLFSTPGELAPAGGSGSWRRGLVTPERAQVTDFLRSNGVPARYQAEIHSGINYSKPVEITTIKGGTPVEQWVRARQATALSPGQQVDPGGAIGSWVGEPGVQPPDVGLYKGDRVSVPLEANQDIPVIKSTAKPIVDTWTTDGKTGYYNHPVFDSGTGKWTYPKGYFTPGGGTQYYVPRPPAPLPGMPPPPPVFTVK